MPLVCLLSGIIQDYRELFYFINPGKIIAESGPIAGVYTDDLADDAGQGIASAALYDFHAHDEIRPLVNQVSSLSCTISPSMMISPLGKPMQLLFIDCHSCMWNRSK